MTRISSRWTFFFKRVFLVCFLGICGLIFATVFANGAGRLNPMQIAVFLGMALVPILIGCGITWWIVSKLVDEVWDCGCELLVRNDAKEDRIPLADIDTLDYSTFIQPQQVTLRLRRPSAFGNTITFLPLYRVFQLAMPPIVDELRRRIEESRGERQEE